MSGDDPDTHDILGIGLVFLVLFAGGFGFPPLWVLILIIAWAYFGD